MKHTRAAWMLAAMLALGFISPLRASPADLARKLSGTKWSWPYGDGKPDRAWIILNADGSMKLGWGRILRGWKVIDNYRIQLLDVRDSAGENNILHFNSDFTEAVDETSHQVFRRMEMNQTAPPAGTAADTAFATPKPSATPVAPELQQKADDIIRAYHSSFVFVTGNEGSGSGFIANIGGANFLVTNAHVVVGISGAAFKSLNGTVVQGGAASVAVGCDIFRMAMPAYDHPLEIMQGVDVNASIGDDVVVLGNAEGAGVINTIFGKIVGIGPDRVEIDAPFVPGNSGSPIIHLKTGKVIAVATYHTVSQYDDITHEKMAEPVVRRFGYRIDSVKTWQSVDWRSFSAQAAEMKNIEILTRDLYAFFHDMQVNHRITPGLHTNPVIKNRIDQWLAAKNHRLSPEDARMVTSNFLSFLKIACETDVTAAQPRMGYDYFQRELTYEQQIRNAMSKAFEDAINGIN